MNGTDGKFRFGTVLVQAMKRTASSKIYQRIRKPLAPASKVFKNDGKRDVLEKICRTDARREIRKFT